MAKPSIVTVILFSFLSFWNEIHYFNDTSDKTGTENSAGRTYELDGGAEICSSYGQMYAGLVIVMLPTLILYICVQKKLTQGMTLGGLKG